MSAAEPFTCPCCGMVSHHPDDVAYRYCSRCHWWTGDPELGHPHHGAPCPPQAARQLQEAVAKAGPPEPLPVVTVHFPLDPGQLPEPRCWDCGASFKPGEGYGEVFCTEVCADAFKASLGL